MDIQKVSPEEAEKIIETRQPLGKFYCIDKPAFNGIYIGIDNEDGEAWTEEFRTLDECKRWLLGDETGGREVTG
jgi:hypothetical protein